MRGVMMNEREGGNGNPAGSTARPLGDFLKDFLKSSGLSRRSSPKDLSQDWSDIVGTELARGSRVLGIQQGALLVEVESPAIQQELSVFLKETILARMKEKYPKKNIVALKCVQSSQVRSPRKTEL